MTDSISSRLAHNGRFTGLCALLLVASSCATAPKPAPVSSNYVNEKTHSVDGRLFIGPQPELLDIEDLREKGFTKVINFRTPDEMKKLSFDEVVALGASGISYAQIPVGGDDYPYSPAQLQSLSEELQNSNDKLLLHCGSGWRASVITVAWLVEEQGMPLGQAIQHAEGWWPLSLEKVLGREFELVERP